MNTGSRTPITRTSGFLPAFALALGAVMLAAAWVTLRLRR